MKRGRRIAVVAHCLLNVNAKVHGLALYPGAHDLVSGLLADETGLIQLPCPEASFLGMARWGMTKEQYDVPAYRRHCRHLLEPVIDTLAALAEDGCEIVGAWGVDGSPSCGVDRTCAGYEGGDMDRLIGPPTWSHVPGSGVLIDVFRSLLADRGLAIEFRAVPEDE